MPAAEHLADVVAWVHLAFVAFVVVGLVVILTGAVFRWAWVRHSWFRTVHLGAIGFVAVRCWFGIRCPLTVLEARLRAGAPPAGGGALHLAHAGVFRGAAPMPFAIGTTLFFAAVLLAYVCYGPRWRVARGVRGSRAAEATPPENLSEPSAPRN
jgi:hypothetical protein